MRRLAWFAAVVVCACGGARGTGRPVGVTAGRAVEIARLGARGEAGVSGLVALSRSSGRAVAGLALRGLGRVGDAAAVARLAEVLAAERGRAAVAAAEALGL